MSAENRVRLTRGWPQTALKRAKGFAPADTDASAAERVASTPVAERTRLRRRSRGRGIGEWIVVVLLAVSFAMLVRHFVIQSYSIPSPSMHPTLKVKDRLLVSKLTYQWDEIRRGDIIVFKKPAAMKGAGTDGISDLVKRVIGLPGETVEARDGVVYIDGKKLDETYLPPGTVTTDLRTTTVPIDEYFMMGDNRADSLDSRWWGTIRRQDVVGKVVFRFWPPTRIGTVD